MRRYLVLFFTVAALAVATPSYAGFDEGRAAYDQKDWRTAIANLRPAAEEGDTRAMILLANMYSEGYGVLQDKPQAFGLYHRAAMLDNIEAMIAVATMYQNGIGVDPNTRLAIGWFHRAARLGDQKGMFFYGIHLYQGTKSATFDLPPDREGAYRWFRLAEHNGPNKKLSAAAQQVAIVLSQKMPIKRVVELDEMVAAWAPLAPEDLGPPPEKDPAYQPNVAPAGDDPAASRTAVP